MASAVFDKGREAFLSGSISWSSDTIKVALLRTSAYTVNTSTDQFATIFGTAVSTTSALASKTVTAGVANAASATFTAVTAGAAVNCMVIYKDTGTASTSPVIAYIDGFSVTPNGGDVGITWDTGANKIFKL